MATEFMVGSTPGWKSPGIRRWRHASLLLLTGGLVVDGVQSALSGAATAPGILAPWFWAVAAVCTVLELALALPLQNALAASFQTAGLVWMVGAMGHRLGVSLDVIPRATASLPGGVTPALLAAWVTLSPCFRTLARAMLSARRDRSRIGFEILAVTSVLGGTASCLIQPATPQRDWRTILCWMVIAVVLHGVNTPWLLNKRPARESPGITTLALPGLIGIGMLRGPAGTMPWESLGVAGLAILLVLGLAWRGLARAR